MSHSEHPRPGQPDESHRLSPHPDTTGHGCPSDPEPPRPDPVDPTREPEQPNAADNVGSPGGQSIEGASSRRTSLAGREKGRLFPWLCRSSFSPSSITDTSIYFERSDSPGHRQTMVSPASPSDLQMSPNTRDKVKLIRSMSMRETESGSARQEAGVSTVPSGRETEPSVMDKALERHIVSHGSGGASSKRPNNLALYAVLLVIALILLAFAVYFAIFKKAHLSVVVDAPWGKYRGKYKPVEGLSCYSFLGIPFANGGAPRFGLPQRPGPGAFQETSGSAPCLQPPLRLGNFAVFDAPRGTEDCLRLNLWTPSIEYKGLAVLVFFLGFEFYYGGNSQESLSGEYLSALGDLVVVVPNYRLGPLGFLNAKLSDAPGNQALYDQRHALDWVRENVRFFGGDPARIVLHGYEAGAVSIGYQLMSPLDHWVKSVSRLILQSGSPLRLFKNNTSASLENLHSLQLSMKCPSDGDVRSVLDFLRRVEPETFALPATHTDLVFGPSFDTKFLPAYPSQLLNPDPFNGKDVLLGTVAGEGVVLAELYISSRHAKPPDVRALLMQLLDAYGVLDAGRLLELYASHGQWDNHTLTVGFAKRVLGDVLYTCPVLYLAEHVSSSRNNSVHSYVFDHKPSFSVWPDPVAAQYEDLDFVFGVPLRQGVGTPEEQGLSRRLIQLVAGFAKNGALPELTDGAPWPQYSGLDNETVHITLGGYTLSAESRWDHCSRIRPHIFY